MERLYIETHHSILKFKFSINVELLHKLFYISNLLIIEYLRNWPVYQMIHMNVKN